MESVHTRRRVVRGANGLRTELQRQRRAGVHGLFDCGWRRLSLGVP